MKVYVETAQATKYMRGWHLLKASVNAVMCPLMEDMQGISKEREREGGGGRNQLNLAKTYG